MLKPWLTQEWCVPTAASAAFVAAMEDSLAVYQRPPDPTRPLVCFDEAGKELQADVRPSLPPAPSLPARIDSEYRRAGRANLFLWCAPHLGQRQVMVTTQRTQSDWAEQMRALVDEHFPAAARIVVVLDNLNTHTPAALYATFPPAEAQRLWDKLELHYPPNMAGGSTWPRSSSVSWRGSVSAAAFPTTTPSPARSRPGPPPAMRPVPPSTGSAPPPMPASDSSGSTPCSNRTDHDGWSTQSDSRGGIFEDSYSPATPER